MKYLIDTLGNYYEAERNVTGATEVPKRPDPFYEWVDGAWVENAGDKIASERAGKLRNIEADRDAACVANVSAHGRMWQADTKSQALLGQAITLASAGLPLPSVWRDADNLDMPVATLADLLVIAGAIAAQVQTSYSASWLRKAVVEAATTVEEINAA